VRATAALALLELDDVDSAAIAGNLLVADGDAFATLVNQIRQKADLQPLTWDAGEATLM
jgi:uncharacterized protein YkwD